MLLLLLLHYTPQSHCFFQLYICMIIAEKYVMRAHSLEQCAAARKKQMNKQTNESRACFEYDRSCIWAAASVCLISTKRVSFEGQPVKMGAMY